MTRKIMQRILLSILAIGTISQSNAATKTVTFINQTGAALRGLGLYQSDGPYKILKDRLIKDIPQSLSINIHPVRVDDYKLSYTIGQNIMTVINDDYDINFEGKEIHIATTARWPYPEACYITKWDGAGQFYGHCINE